jgi:spore coat protein CotF
MILKDKTLYSFLLNILVDENCSSAQLITSQDVSSLLKRIEKINLKSISIDPEISDVNDCNDDIFIVLDDITLSESDIGTIKNLLSQKIVIFTDFKKDKNIDDVMLRLGFQNELRDSKNKLKCFSYNLKTYNNKRSWNNAEGWANPENFDKFRW